MSRKPLTRLVAVIEGQFLVLLSIRENPSGSLILKPKRSKFAVVEDVYREAGEQKITVHRSGSSFAGLNAIHHTLQTLDGKTFETHQLTAAVRDRGVQCIYRHRVGNMTNQAPTQIVRPKDTVIKVAAYEPRASTLNFLVFIGPPDATVDMVSVDDLSFGRWVVNFQHFSVIAITSYTVITSPYEGWLRHHATAPITIDGVRGGEPLDPSPALSPDVARDLIRDELVISHYEVLKQALELMAGDEPERNVEPEVLELINIAHVLGPRRRPYIPGDPGSLSLS